MTKIKEKTVSLEVKVVRVPVKKINPAAYNPRKELKPGDREYESIKASIRAHGLVDPLVWNQHNGVLIGGHQRFKILVDEFGAKDVWCSVRNIKDLKEEMSLNAALNKNQGEWDFAKLKSVLFNFNEDDPDSFLRAAMGFTPIEFDGLMEWTPKLTDHDDLNSKPSDRLGAYQEGAIKQIVLYFSGAEFGSIIDRLEKVRKSLGVDDNTSAFVGLLKSYEDNHA